MSKHTLTRITNVLRAQFEGRIDLAEWQSRPEIDRDKAFLSRALAALCIKTLARVDNDTAAKAVTDGFHDNGLDAVHYSPTNDTLYLVQSKWSPDGTKPMDADGTSSLAAGARDILNAAFERFNEKVRAKEPVVRTALYSERPLRIVLVTAHTATQPIAPFVKRKIDELVEELNDPVQVAEGLHYDQAGVYGLITSESKPPKIKLQISLHDWGSIERPFLAFYGRVPVDEIFGWWEEHGNALFTQNLRLYHFSSDVNAALNKTLASQPEYFWYFNNGITVICDSIAKAAVGSPKRLIGVFTCDGASIVNGAQTVGTIGNKSPPHADAPESWVQVRIISLADCPPEFARTITRAANLQNAVGNREFAAMDSVQHRLATDFALDKRRYVYKTGETDPKGEEGCDIVEATQALACARSTQLAVLAKRELGSLWADTNSAPYTDLFNDDLSSTKVWRCVCIMRTVDQELQKLKETNHYSAWLIAVHLNRIILHLVFNDPEVKQVNHDGSTLDECIVAARRAANRVFPNAAEFIRTHFPDNYLASLSKNTQRCETLVNALLEPSPEPAERQGKLL